MYVSERDARGIGLPLAGFFPVKSVRHVLFGFPDFIKLCFFGLWNSSNVL